MREQLKGYLNQDIALVNISQIKKGVKSEFSKVLIKPFLQKDEVMYQLEYTKGNQVVHKNIKSDVLIDEIEYLLREVFVQCIIYGANNDYHLNCFKDKITAKTKPASKKVSISSHNRKKEYILNEYEDIDFLKYLGVMSNDGRIIKSKYNKFRQINKYLELISPIFENFEKEKELKIVDFGCGKAYLTFALYYYVVKILKRKAIITGLDLKTDVINYCNDVSKKLGYEFLEFMHGDIKDYTRTKDVDLVIMLHACDNATDEGIVQSIKFNAKAIVAVPCCQHEFFTQIKNDNINSMLQFGLIKERFSALATDSLRAQILKSLGFDVTIMEFIETEHTPKNIAIKAIKKQGFNNEEFSSYQSFKEFINVQPYIEKRLKEENLLK